MAELNDIAVVIGMPRAGTTWLYENLRKHPDICVSDIKEINRYLTDMDDSRYLSLFKCRNRKVSLDISPLYFFSFNAMQQINKHHSKVILLVREPKSWMQSLVKQVSKYDHDFDIDKSNGVFTFPVDAGSITFDSRNYHHEEYIDQIRSLFGSKLTVIDFDQLQSAPVDTLNRVETCLGISSYFTKENSQQGKVNAGDQQMSKLYAFLMQYRILHRLIPVILKILPSPVIHWLRRRLVYGGDSGNSP